MSESEQRSRLSLRDRAADDLQEQLDDINLRLLTALDAVAGAEAERSRADARVRELELKQHMLEVERDELLREVERLSRSKSNLRAAAHVARSLARRLMS